LRDLRFWILGSASRPQDDGATRAFRQSLTSNAIALPLWGGGARRLHDLRRSLFQETPPVGTTIAEVIDRTLSQFPRLAIEGIEGCVYWRFTSRRVWVPLVSLERR
jgi:hypothetical protein